MINGEQVKVDVTTGQYGAWSYYAYSLYPKKSGTKPARGQTYYGEVYADSLSAFPDGNKKSIDGSNYWFERCK